MSTVLSSSDVLAPVLSSEGTRLSRWLREPLLHFIILGGVLFGLDSVIATRTEDPNTIVIGAEVDNEARQAFEAARGRLPNEQELKALRQVWLDNEVLYREGLALELDRGDTALRERVIFKMLSIVDAGTKRPPYEDKVLRAWFESNRAKYDEPARYDFQEAVLSGESSEAAVRAFVNALNAGAAPDVEADLRLFTGRPHGNLVQSYGEEFAKSLEESPRGEWRALRSREGWRAMRLESITPVKPADFEQLRGVVLQDWTDTMLAEQRSAAVGVLAKKYNVLVAGADE